MSPKPFERPCPRSLETFSTTETLNPQALSKPVERQRPKEVQSWGVSPPIFSVLSEMDSTASLHSGVFTNEIGLRNAGANLGFYIAVMTLQGGGLQRRYRV